MDEDTESAAWAQYEQERQQWEAENDPGYLAWLDEIAAQAAYEQE